ncbi:MAG: HD domain-containing protein [Candidatus Latescibacteria bacterium]|nr:HD domain-containing protein [Candidatus Latescibacterota bacterium]
MTKGHTSELKGPLELLLRHVPQSYRPLVGQAYHLASASHEGQDRDTGQPFIIHPVGVALILASELGFARDAEMMVAALLHDAVEDSALDLDDITPTFGDAVATLVRGVSKVEGVHVRSRSARRAAALQRLFTAARQDPRVLILKLADRVNNMRSIEGIKERKRKRRIAQETADVYAPLAHLLGMDRIRRELDDRSLSCLEPSVYRKLGRALEADQGESFRAFRDETARTMAQAGIRHRVRLHAKSLASLRRKTAGKEVGVSDVYDRLAVEIMVSNRDACYRSLGAVHGRFVPLMERFKDFIAIPKRNGYQALHTTVIEQGMRFEVHIQTPSMYRMGELGVATLRGDALQEERRRRWLRDLAEWHVHAGPSERFLDEMKRILFVQEMATFTPKGDPIVLPEGATLVDFAFAVHTDLGLHCTGGRVNNRPASPFSVLNWGDTVQIETSATQQPASHWLRYVKTYRARRLIRRQITRAQASDKG